MKRLFLASTFILLSSLFLLGPMAAQSDTNNQKNEKKRIFLKTRATKSLSIYVYPFAGSHPRKITGEVIVAGKAASAEKIVFYLETKYKEKIWRKELLWRDRFQRDNQIRIPFVFDLPERNVETDLKLKATIEAPYEKVIAEGEKMVFLPKIENEALDFSVISNLNIVTGDTKTLGSFMFKNKSILTPLKTRITIKPDTLSQAEAQEIWVNMSEVPLDQTDVIKFDFETPKQPQLYIIGVQVFTEDDIPLSGILEKNLLVKGLFAEVINFDYEPKNYWKQNKNVTINFSGEISDPLINNVEARIKILTHKENLKAGSGLTENIYQNTETITTNRYRQITGASTFNVPWGVEQVRGIIEFIADEKVIGTFDFTTPIYPAPAKTISEKIVSTLTTPLAENKTLSVIQKVLVMLGLILFLICLVLFIIFIIKKKNKKHLIWAMCLTIPFANISAENRHFTHFDHEVYTSSIAPSPSLSLGDDLFRLIPIRGIAETVSGGNFLPGNNVQAKSYFFPPEVPIPRDEQGELPIDNNDLIIAGAVMAQTDFTAETESDYFYEIEIENNGNFQIEGEYKLVRMEFDPTGASFIPVVDFEKDKEYTLTIDNSAPVVNFELRKPGTTEELKDPAEFLAKPEAEKTAELAAGYFVNGPVEVTIDCGEDCLDNESTFQVLGNFCSDPLICDSEGIRSFTFCDGIMNCSQTPEELELKHFDGVAPSFTNFELKLQANETIKRVGNDATPLKVDEKYTFSVLDTIEETDIDKNSVDSHACGGGESDTLDNFFNNETTCQQKIFNCAISSNQRGSMNLLNTNNEVLDANDWVCNATCQADMIPYYCGATDPNHPNNGGNGQQNCCLPACKFSFPYCFPLPFY
jgi:hypothetical protein